MGQNALSPVLEQMHHIPLILLLTAYEGVSLGKLNAFKCVEYFRIISNRWQRSWRWEAIIFRSAKWSQPRRGISRQGEPIRRHLIWGWSSNEGILRPHGCPANVRVTTGQLLWQTPVSLPTIWWVAVWEHSNHIVIACQRCSCFFHRKRDSWNDI